MWLVANTLDSTVVDMRILQMWSRMLLSVSITIICDFCAMDNSLRVMVSTFMRQTYSFLVKFTDSKTGSVLLFFFFLN